MLYIFAATYASLIHTHNLRVECYVVRSCTRFTVKAEEKKRKELRKKKNEIILSHKTAVYRVDLAATAATKNSDFFQS